MTSDQYTLIDLFSGCGGLTQGFVETGRFKPVFAIDSDPRATDTYAANFGAEHVRCGLIEDVRSFPRATVVVGGPPCQGFSLLNKEGVGLERRGLWTQYFRCLEQSQPLAFVMENVPQLLGSEEYIAFVEAAERAGYVAEGRILNAADYGVPQTRRRTIVIGMRGGPILWPEPTHSDEGDDLLPPWRTFRDAVKGLPRRPNEQNWHRSRNPTQTSIDRYRTIPNEGEGRFELAERRPDITPRCWLDHHRGSTDVFGRLWWDRPAFTIRTEFYKPEKGRYLHPSEHRPITVREAARCMTFPDSFTFPEDQSMTAVGKQIGNAVPPRLSLALAKAVAAALDTTARSVALLPT